MTAWVDMKCISPKYCGDTLFPPISAATLPEITDMEVLVVYINSVTYRIHTANNVLWFMELTD